MSSPPSSPPPADRIRWRQIVDAGDPQKVRALVEATGVFSSEETRIAGELVETTLSGTETYRFLFAYRGDALLGYTCFDLIPLSSVSFDLYWIAVAPTERGSGLALDLMARTAAIVKSRGGLQIFAETSSRAPYAPARAFYRKAGFDEAARFADFYTVGDDRLVFRLRI